MHASLTMTVIFLSSGFESKETVAAERTSTDWKGEKGTYCTLFLCK